MTTEEKLSAKQVAIELGTDARTLRKFFRSGESPVDPVGQGGRYEISRKSIKKVKKAFDAWGSKSKTPTKKASTPAKVIDDPEVEEIDLEDDVEIIDLEDLEGPSDDDLMELD